MKRILAIFICILVGNIGLAQNKPKRNDEVLLESGNYASTVPTNKSELKVVSYNIRWRGGKELRKLVEILKKDSEIGGADIVCLQEVDRYRKRTNLEDASRLIAKELGWNYVWAAPPVPEGKLGDRDYEEQTGVAIFSPYPISDPERLVLPHPGPRGRRRGAVGATVHVGSKLLRVYSVHAETRIPVEKKMEQLKSVILALSAHENVRGGLIMGDFNTVKDKDVEACKTLFKQHYFTTPIPHDKSTFKTAVLLKLKLDWLWLQLLESTEYGMADHIKLSDHKPIWVKVKL